MSETPQSWLSRRLAARFLTAPNICDRCQSAITRPDGCSCYYIAIRKAAEQKDMIGRLDAWSRQQTHPSGAAQ